LAYHFTDKEGLYTACVERLYEDLARYELAPQDGADPIEAIVRGLWAVARDHRVHVRLLHRHLLDRGHHPELASARWPGPLLDRIDPVVAALRPGWSATERRLLVYTGVHLVVRFVLEDPAELGDAVGVSAERVDEVVVAWLARLVRAVAAPG